MLKMEDFLSSIINKIIKSKELKHSTDKEKSEIIKLLRLAIKNTSRHIEQTRIGENGSDTLSDSLVNEWARIAELIRPFDNRLARLFDSKSDYWFNPTLYKEEASTGKRRFDFRFRLSEVKKIEAALNEAWFG